MAKKPYSKRMAELMIPIDNAIMMTDDRSDLMMLASAMLASSRQIFITNLGVAGTRLLFQEVVDLLTHDEVAEKIGKKNAKTKGRKDESGNL